MEQTSKNSSFWLFSNVRKQIYFSQSHKQTHLRSLSHLLFLNSVNIGSWIFRYLTRRSRARQAYELYRKIQLYITSSDKILTCIKCQKIDRLYQWQKTRTGAQIHNLLYVMHTWHNLEICFVFVRHTFRICEANEADPSKIQFEFEGDRSLSRTHNSTVACEFKTVPDRICYRGSDLFRTVLQSVVNAICCSDEFITCHDYLH